MSPPAALVIAGHLPLNDGRSIPAADAALWWFEFLSAGNYTRKSGRAARAFGSLKEKLPGSSSTPSPTQGVSVEVGERQAAIDLELVVEYGVAISDLAEAVRRNVIGRVERMTGLEVTEVNITVDDVFLGDESDERSDRVQ
jgi:uncharacterized alkaline shock family protein YloU